MEIKPNLLLLYSIATGSRKSRAQRSSVLCGCFHHMLVSASPLGVATKTSAPATVIPVRVGPVHVPLGVGVPPPLRVGVGVQPPPRRSVAIAVAVFVLAVVLFAALVVLDDHRGGGFERRRADLRWDLRRVLRRRPHQRLRRRRTTPAHRQRRGRDDVENAELNAESAERWSAERDLVEAARIYDQVRRGHATALRPRAAQVVPRGTSPGCSAVRR